MRLNPHQIQAISFAIEKFLENSPAELRLYGSRVHDHLRGGDIDLLLLLDDADLVDRLKAQKHFMLVKIKGEIGDEKIDLLIEPRDMLKKSTFLKLIFPKSVLLKKWGVKV